jgi:hypothetical protein|eukprot:2161869-Prymnesium_polylepis.2
MFAYDACVVLHGLKGRPELNNRAARVCSVAPRADGRLGVQLLVGAERFWAKPENLAALNQDNIGKLPLSDADAQDARMYTFAMDGSSPVPGIAASVVHI